MSETRDQLLFDLFTTACEGGINYWASVTHYQWKDAKGNEDVKGFSASIVDMEADDYKGEDPKRIDRSVIAKGYRLATTEFRDRICWSCDKPPVVITPDTDWDYDASDADVIAQLGLFGDVVYG